MWEEGEGKVWGERMKREAEGGGLGQGFWVRDGGRSGMSHIFLIKSLNLNTFQKICIFSS